MELDDWYGTLGKLCEETVDIRGEPTVSEGRLGYPEGHLDEVVDAFRGFERQDIPDFQRCFEKAVGVSKTNLTDRIHSLIGFRMPFREAYQLNVDTRGKIRKNGMLGQVFANIILGEYQLHIMGMLQKRLRRRFKNWGKMHFGIARELFVQEGVVLPYANDGLPKIALAEAYLRNEQIIASFRKRPDDAIHYLNLASAVCTLIYQKNTMHMELADAPEKFLKYIGIVIDRFEEGPKVELSTQWAFNIMTMVRFSLESRGIYDYTLRIAPLMERLRDVEQSLKTSQGYSSSDEGRQNPTL